MGLIEYNGQMIDPSRITETFTVQVPKSGQGNVSLHESSDGTYALPRIEAIHAGSTLNHTHYLAEKLKGDPVKKTGVYSWTHPYNKPVIYNHDTYTAATGRVVSAAYSDYTQAGRPGIILIPKITDPEAVKALQDGRLLTVSIGATTDSVICSISGKDILKDGPSGYIKGETYDGKVCEWIIGDLWFEELSWVNVPADQNAMVVGAQSSVFLDAPGMSEESLEASLKTSESANRSLQEMFGLPEGVPITVPGLQEETALKESAEILEKEETQGMAEAENKELETTQEEIVVEGNEETAVVVEEEETESLTEAPVEEPEEVVVEEEAPIEEEATEEDTALVEAQAEIAGLREQVASLSNELRESYIRDILIKSNLADEKREAYVEKLKSRTLESLRDTLEDLQDIQMIVGEPIAEEKKEAKRTIVQVEKPIKESTEVKTTVSFTESDKIDALASLLKGI